MFVTLDLRIGVFAVIYLFTCAVCIQYGSPGNTLYVAKEPQKGLGKTYVINKGEEGSSLERQKRDASDATPPLLQRNISTWTTHLNDSHQQLMVHWVGEGSNVIICLARDSSPKSKGVFSPSALFISYDYGKNFTNKTDMFKLDDTPDSGYAQLDKFFNHPKYPEFCVFVDSTNKKLFYTSDNGQHINRSDLSFHPSELAFDEEFPNIYVILDKVDSNRNLYLTLDGGKSFKKIQSYVKTFIWATGPGVQKTFYVERWKPNGTSTVLSASDPTDFEHATTVFQDAKDFQIKGDFMFATKLSKERNTLDLYISHMKGPFYKAEFETELDMKKFHIADVTDKRIFVSVMHTEILADLYVSEISNDFTRYNFMLSLEQILCYFPDGNWKDTWLEDMTEDPFTDLYRVEGLKGIYIASRVDSKAQVSHVGPEHLISLITFDHGVNWSPVNPPTEDENGKPLNCHIENSCSLHLCQKFSQLYPVTRSASIMSSKSAPGIIMATGVMGKSLKGIPGVYLSRDAGLTWKRILKDYYFFNYGDHGGVLVAVKYFKLRGETNKILYSTNEGIEWNSYQFNGDDLRIYGLMTEPGENTTTFTMFGSANDQHQWIIITIDLQNAFAKNCTAEDYKFWSPSPPNSSVSCVLGTRDTFQRRLAHTNCYNGINYDRPVKKELCECSRRDFECDVGFQLSNNACVRNKSSKHDPYATPMFCRPGTLYQRTKGYRKIDGDVCKSSTYIPYAPDMVPCPLDEPTEFILVALRDKIARIDLSDNSTLFPVKGQSNIVAIEFDLKNNCIYWADIETDKINRQCFNNGTVQEVIVDTDLASIEGMALDWISNVLFFVDGMRKKIEAVRTDLSIAGRMRVTILDSKVLSKPRGIAVHPKAGYLFWTDWDRSNPTVSRSNLDGKNVKKLFGKPIVQWPNGITIDQMAERIYWVDAMEDYIASADLDGRYFKRILWRDEKVSHPFAVAVLKGNMYWDDWKAKSIFIADKDSGDNVITINNSFSGLMDLKVFAHFVQHGSNACSYKNTSCDTMCLGGPGKSFSCLCPNGFTMTNGKCMCSNGLEPSANMTCKKKEGASCDPDQFTCANGMCITASWQCNGNNDCGDLSDEIGCPLCAAPMLSCDDASRCYLPQWRCDGDVDCPDFSDEKNCTKPNCTSGQFQCDTGMCIYKKWVCDGDNDCHDGSDERNCNSTLKRPVLYTCSENSFPCSADPNPICIPNSWVCDGERDCPSGEDEKDDKCRNSTCAPTMFRCPSGKCIFKSWVCDGENDCSDTESSDEHNCTNPGHSDQSKMIPRPQEKADFPSNGTCLDWMFKCKNNNCLPYWWRCDGINDCGDNSDELGCGSLIIDASTAAPEPEFKDKKCAKTQFTCSTGICIPLSWVCDTAEDCPQGEDERNCQRRGGSRRRCGPDETPCGDGRGCVRADQVCDGRHDCADGSDETHCEVCSGPDVTPCGDGRGCVRADQVCDGRHECADGSDETQCEVCSGPDVTPCGDGRGCVRADQVCDGRHDCADGSDEKQCEVCSGPDVTPCGDGRGCVRADQVCDGRHDCSDGSDETHCEVCSGPDVTPCGDGRGCVRADQVCDGRDDCADGSDETHCEVCSGPDVTPCGDGRGCVRADQVCDGRHDCADSSDETHCEVCSGPHETACGDGRGCVRADQVCDGRHDCADSSDETHCEVCSGPHETACGDGRGCVRADQVCDGRHDCADGSDETHCVACSGPDVAMCGDGRGCVRADQVCNGRHDCADGSDETHCVVCSGPDLTPCDDGRGCVRADQVCDGRHDCADGSDETHCEVCSGPHETACGDGRGCVRADQVCDGCRDCADGSDEMHCVACSGPDETPCGNGRGCMRADQVCDGRYDCADGSDETHCKGRPDTTKCPEGYTLCGDGMLCISEVSVCNGHQDCYDGSDESNCTSEIPPHGFQILGIGVDQPSINSTSFLISFWMSQQKMFIYSFLPSISKVSDGVWKNMTWIHESTFRFTDLEPYTQYNVTFYIQDTRTNKTYPSMKYVNTTTGEGKPSPPLKVSVAQLTGSRVQVAWDPPASPKGQIQYYTVSYSPPVPPMDKKTRGAETNITINGYFRPNMSYSFWITATNGAYTSDPTPVMNLIFDDVGDVDDLNHIGVTRINESTALLTWDKIKGIEGFKLVVRPPAPSYVPWDPITTNATNITLTNLPTGVHIDVDIMAYKGTITGHPLTIFLKPEGVIDDVINSTAYLIKEKRTSVRLEWSPPTSDRYKGRELEYAVYYNDVMHTRIPGKETKLLTKQTSMQIDDLHACESYIFAVTLANGPIAKLHEIMTRENAKAPIKNLHVVFKANKTKMEILWNANCDVIHEAVAYRLDITEQTRNKVSSYDLKPTTDVSLSHTIENVAVGGRYNICINANVPSAAVTCKRVIGQPLPAPAAVVAWLAPNGHLMVNWQNRQEDVDHKYTYEIIVSETEIPEDLLHPTVPMRTETAERSPRLITVPVTNGPLYCAVRTKSEDGYYSDISEVHTLEMLGSPEPEVSATSALWWGGGAALIGSLVLGGALLHVLLRNRRLARSLLRFSYDSRRGQATIDHDDDDVPPIHGFSDDEPLVIA